LILADVAQLDRASGYGPEGSGFEFWHPHHLRKKGCITYDAAFFLAMKNDYSTYLKRYARSQHMCRSLLSAEAFETSQNRYRAVVKGNHFNADYEDYVRLKKALCLDISPEP
jgi:hypothetical protein